MPERVGISDEGYPIALITFPEFGPASGVPHHSPRGTLLTERCIVTGAIYGNDEEGLNEVPLAYLIAPQRRWHHDHWTLDEERAYVVAALKEAWWFARSLDASYARVYLSFGPLDLDALPEDVLSGGVVMLRTGGTLANLTEADYRRIMAGETVRPRRR